MLCSLAMAALACSTVSYETKAYPRDWPVSLCTATCEGGERHTLLLGRARAAEGAYTAQRWRRPAPLLPPYKVEKPWASDIEQKQLSFRKSFLNFVFGGKGVECLKLDMLRVDRHGHTGLA